MTDIENSGVAGVSSPLDSILGGDGVVQPPPQESEQAQIGSSSEPIDDEESGHVPLAALKRVRERAARDAARVRELEDEIAKYHEQNWGIDQPQQLEAQQQDAPPDNDAEVQKARERLALAWEESYANFLGKHGKEAVASIDSALNALPDNQKAYVLSLVSQGDGDPAERVYAYIKQIGAIGPEFTPSDIAEVLSGKVKKAKVPNLDEVESKLARLEEREQSIAAAERRTTFNASRAEFVSEFGRDQFSKLSAACEAFANSGNPDAKRFVNMLLTSPQPIQLAARVMSDLGMWSQQEPAPPPRAAVMPSNLVGTRSVASRSGPTYSGPTALNDIFARSR